MKAPLLKTLAILAASTNILCAQTQREIDQQIDEQVNKPWQSLLTFCKSYKAWITSPPCEGDKDCERQKSQLLDSCGSDAKQYLQGSAKLRAVAFNPTYFNHPKFVAIRVTLDKLDPVAAAVIRFTEALDKIKKATSQKETDDALKDATIAGDKLNDARRDLGPAIDAIEGLPR
jgi:hypothetical protein